MWEEITIDLDDKSPPRLICECGISKFALEKKFDYAFSKDFSDHIHQWDVLVKYRCHKCNKQIRPNDIHKTLYVSKTDIRNYCSKECWLKKV